jgi:hypothetical protein
MDACSAAARTGCVRVLIQVLIVLNQASIQALIPNRMQGLMDHLAVGEPRKKAAC